MNADKRSFKHGEITRQVIGAFYEVYNELGHGFLESVYAKSLQIALLSKGLKAYRKIDVPVTFRGKSVGTFEADMLVELFAYRIEGRSRLGQGSRSAITKLSQSDGN